MRRKPIRMITIVGDDGDERLMVLCDDGTIWGYEFEAGAATWWQMPEIPPDTPEQQFEPPPRQPE